MLSAASCKARMSASSASSSRRWNLAQCSVRDPPKRLASSHILGLNLRLLQTVHPGLHGSPQKAAREIHPKGRDGPSVLNVAISLGGILLSYLADAAT